MIHMDALTDLCRAAGQDPDDVLAVMATPTFVTFTVAMRDAQGKKFIDPLTGSLAMASTTHAVKSVIA